MNGYEAEIYEMHDKSGGLCTAWKRKGYTIDGCIHWLTGARPGCAFHDLYREVGALEGLGPDDPAPQPLRVVVDGQLRTPAAARMLALPGEVAVACLEGPGMGSARALTAAGARVVALPASHGRVDLNALMAWLADREINEVLIESGPTLAGAALTAGIIDELILYLAPHLMGDDGRGLFHLPGIERMEHRIPLRISDLRRIGPDLRLTLRPDRS